MAVARVLGTFSFSAAQLARFDLASLTAEVLDDAWQLISGHRHATSTKPPKKSVVQEIVADAASQFSLDGHRVVEARQPYARSLIDEAFLDAVDRALPSQPWNPGVHRAVAERLRSPAWKVTDAIEMLIVAGRRYEQKDGVVFNADGSVLSFDPDRVTEEGARTVEPE